jgi:hypothetical protein
MIAALLRRLTRSGFRRGMTGSNTWLIVGVLAGGARILRHLSRNDEDVLYRTVVKPGDIFEIITKPPSK